MQILYFYYPLIAFLLVHVPGLNYKQRQISYLLLICFYIFMVLSFFDMDAVPDVIYYNEVFDTLGKISLSEYENITTYKFEYGYLVYSKIVGSFFASARSLYVIRAIFSAFVFYYIVKRYSVNIYLTGIVYIMFAGDLVQAAFVIRQYLSIFIFFLAIPSLLEKRLVSYLLIVTTSALFHTAAIVYFPLYFVYHYVNLKKWNVVIVFSAIIIMAVFSFTIMESTSSYLGIYESYYDTDGEGLGSYGMALRALFVLAPFFFLYNQVMNDNYGMFCFKTAAISFVLAVGMWGVGSGSRLFEFYNYFSIFSIPWCYMNLKRRTSKAIYLIGILSVFSFLFFKGYGTSFEVRYLWE